MDKDVVGMKSATQKNSIERRVARIVHGFKLAGIKLLAFDFDLTLLNIHTHGRWQSGAVELSEHLRPVFVELIKQCMKNSVIIAVVTFSQQTELVASTLEHALEGVSISCEYGRLVRGEILLRGMDDTWRAPNITRLSPVWALFSGMGGKVGHILAIVHQLETHGSYIHGRSCELFPENILYFDDDMANCEITLGGATGICTAVIPICDAHLTNDMIVQDLERKYCAGQEFQHLTLEHARSAANALYPGGSIGRVLTSYCMIM